MSMHTKCNAAVAHPSRDFDRFVRVKAGNLLAGEHVPHNGNLVSVIADSQSPGAIFAKVVGSNQQHISPMLLELALNGKRIVVQAKDDVALRMKKVRRRGRTGLELILNVIKLWSVVLRRPRVV